MSSRSSSSHLFTSESVSVGHPDKVADQISDAVLDAMLEQDPMSRVACETMVSTGMVVVAGEVTTKAYVEIPDVVRQTVKEIGYISGDIGFDYESCSVMSQDAKRQGDAEGEGEAEHGQFHGRRQPAQNLLGDRPAGDQRHAEVAPGEIPEIDPELLE